MRVVWGAATAAFALATVVATAQPALAAAPSNDTYAGRTVVGSLPFFETLDTTEATTDAADATGMVRQGSIERGGRLVDVVRDQRPAPLDHGGDMLVWWSAAAGFEDPNRARCSDT